MSMQNLAAWAEDLEANGRNQNTIRQYQRCLVRFMADQRVELMSATEQDVVVFLAKMSNRGPSRQLHLKALRSFYRWAAEHRIGAEDITRRMRPKPIPVTPPDTFSHEELRAIVDAARRRHPKRALAILAAYGLGLRRTEIASLKPDDIDFDRRRVYIRQSKGGKSRWVEMSTTAEQALNDLRPYWNGTVLGSVHPVTFSRWVSEAATEAGLPCGRRRAHMLRSAYCTALLEQGARIEVVRDLLGHSSIATTQRYAVIRGRARQDTVALVPPL